MRTHKKIIIAHHLILSGYGHWLPNDPRGSGSDTIRNDDLMDLGPIHHGRKAIQPPKSELKKFYRRAEPRLDQQTIWFDDAMRAGIADAIMAVVEAFTYTLWACAICRNHIHLVVRKHRDNGDVIWRNFAEGTRQQLLGNFGIAVDHPVWSDRPYTVFLYSPEDVRTRIRYVEQNPIKEGLGAQRFGFVKAYDGWPHIKGH